MKYLGDFTLLGGRKTQQGDLFRKHKHLKQHEWELWKPIYFTIGTWGAGENKWENILGNTCILTNNVTKGDDK